MLRQEIMCNANTRIYTQWWTATHKGPRQDFSFTDQCKDFDAILNWFDEHAVDMSDTYVRKRPESVIIPDTP